MNDNIFPFINCLGAFKVVGSKPTPGLHTVSNFSSQYIYDTGEFVISWNYDFVDGYMESSSVDFFVITAAINGYEIIIGSHPSIGFTDYMFRTQSFLKVAGAVSFRLYPVYNDFRIDSNPSYITQSHVVHDINGFVEEVKVN